MNEPRDRFRSSGCIPAVGLRLVGSAGETVMIIERLELGPFMVNCYILGDRNSGEAVIVDAGDSPNIIAARLDELDLKPVLLVNTHAHVDHTGAVRELMSRFGIDFMIHEKDKPFLEGLEIQAGMFGIQFTGIPEVKGFLKDGQIIEFGDSGIEVLHTPGHSPGSVSFLIRGQGTLLSGDILFAGSIGRTDLPGGSYEEEIRSIREKIMVLPSDTMIYPGHGPETTIEREKKSNPFLR